MEHTKEHTDIGQYPDAEDRMWLRLWNQLDDPGDDDWAYVYSVDRFEKPIKPYLAKYWLYRFFESIDPRVTYPQ